MEARTWDGAARAASGLALSLSMLSGENISARFVVPTVASSIDLVVHLEVDHRGARRVTEIVAVPGRIEQDIIEAEQVFELRDGQLRRGIGMPPRVEQYERVGIDVRRLLHEAE